MNVFSRKKSETNLPFDQKSQSSQHSRQGSINESRDSLPEFRAESMRNFRKSSFGSLKINLGRNRKGEVPSIGRSFTLGEPIFQKRNNINSNNTNIRKEKEERGKAIESKKELIEIFQLTLHGLNVEKELSSKMLLLVENNIQYLKPNEILDYAKICQQITEKATLGSQRLTIDKKVIKIQALVRRFLAQKKIQTLIDKYSTGTVLDARNISFREILQNEQIYFQKMKLIFHVYIHPLRDKVGKREFSIFNHSHIATIFWNAEQLMEISGEFIKVLEEVFNMWPECRIRASVFRPHILKLQAYGDYIRNFKHAQNILEQQFIQDQRFRKFIDDKDSTKKDFKEDLHALLALPLDKIKYYQNSWERILKHTPNSHFDYEDSVEIFSILSQLYTYCESCSDQSLNQANIGELKPKIEIVDKKHAVEILNLWGGEQIFYKSGPVYLHPFNQKKKQERYELLLFTSTFILGKKNKKDKIEPKKIYNLKNTISVIAQENSTTCLEFKEDLVMTPFYFTSPKERDGWLEAIKECVLDLNPKNRIFGVNILDLPQTPSGIPVFLQEVAIQIIQRGQKTFYSNLFSETIIHQTTARELRSRLQASDIFDFGVLTEKELGQTILYFFQSLPSPLLTYEFFPEFVKIIESNNKLTQKVQEFQILLKNLSQKLQKIILFVFAFFHKLCSMNHSEVTPPLIAVLFGHSLLRGKKNNIEQKLVDGPKAGKIVQFLLLQHVFNESFEAEGSEHKKMFNPTEVHSSGTELKLRALYVFKSRKAGEISLEKDDIIKVIEQHPSRWWKGINERTKQTGKFPQNYCKIVEGHHLLYIQQPKSKGGEQTPRTQDKLPDYHERKLQAIHNFKARKDTEISFEKGTMVNVIEKHKSGWWIGEVHGKTGRFPRNYCISLSLEKKNKNLTFNASMDPPSMPPIPQISFYETPEINNDPLSIGKFQIDSSKSFSYPKPESSKRESFSGSFNQNFPPNNWDHHHRSDFTSSKDVYRNESISSRDYHPNRGEREKSDSFSNQNFARDSYPNLVRDYPNSNRDYQNLNRDYSNSNSDSYSNSDRDYPNSVRDYSPHKSESYSYKGERDRSDSFLNQRNDFFCNNRDRSGSLSSNQRPELPNEQKLSEYLEHPNIPISAESTSKGSAKLSQDSSPRSINDFDNSYPQEKRIENKKKEKNTKSKEEIVEEPIIITAKYSFIGRSQKELSFQKGDLVMVSKRPHSQWWKGELDGKFGRVPANYF